MSDEAAHGPDDLEALLRRIEETKDISTTIRVLHWPGVEQIHAAGFVRSEHGSRTRLAWGDNGWSHWVHFYDVPRPNGGPTVLVTVESDGGVDRCVGVFRDDDEARDALRALGRYIPL